MKVTTKILSISVKVFAILMIVLVSQSCQKEGCTNTRAINYDSNAKKDDGSCIVYGCTDPSAANYDSQATTNDGSCIIYGCTNPTATNYNPQATSDDGSCIIYGCTNPSASNYNPNATVDDGSCIIYGCTDPAASNYNPNATIDDGSCVYPMGDGVFWTDADYGHGYISVYLEGTYIGDITNYFSSSPDCYASGCVSFTRYPGTYSFYAEANDGTWWQGSITIYGDNCSKMRLYGKKQMDVTYMFPIE